MQERGGTRDAGIGRATPASWLPLGCPLGCQGEVAEISRLFRRAFRPEDE